MCCMHQNGVNIHVYLSVHELMIHLILASHLRCRACASCSACLAPFGPARSRNLYLRCCRTGCCGQPSHLALPSQTLGKRPPMTAQVRSPALKQLQARRSATCPAKRTQTFGRFKWKTKRTSAAKGIAMTCSGTGMHMANGCRERVAAMPSWYLGQCLLRSAGSYVILHYVSLLMQARLF